MSQLLVQFALAGPKVGPDVGKASPVGLLVVVVLLIGVFLLVRSMNRHLRRIPTSFDAGAVPAETTGAETAAVETSAVETSAVETSAVETSAIETPTAAETESPPRESGG